MTLKQVILLFFTILGLTGWLAATFNLLPSPVAFYLQIFSAILALITIEYGALKSLSERVFSMDFLATIAIVASIISGEYFPATIVALMLLGGEMLENYAQQKSSKAIQKLIEEQPKTAIVLREGKEVQVEPQMVQIGETVIVKPGAKIPVDGVIQQGHAYINQASITGESLPAEKNEGATVYSGTIVQQGAIYISATAVGEESTYGKLVSLVKKAKENKAPIERVADKYAKYFTPAILIIGLTVLALTQDLMRMAAVFVIACPCALILSTPAAIVASIGNAAKQGILIRNGEVLEKMSKVDTLIVDKTGTITKGKLDLIDIQSFSTYTSDQILQFAAETEKYSEHPFAKAITDAAIQKRLLLSSCIDNFEHHPGLGVCINSSNGNIITGNMRLMQKYNVQIPLQAHEYLIRQAKYTVIFVAKQQILLGALSLSDQPRENAKNAIAQIKENGVKKVIMLTGDNKTVTDDIASICDIDQAIAELMPVDKVNKIVALKSQGSTVAMIGDGVNDAPALAQADIGVAMGLSGTEIAIETADIVLVSDDLSNLSKMLKIGKTTLSIIKQNIVFAIAVNIIGIALSSQGLISPLMASIIHESNALIVMFNSLRLLKVK